jgi:acyl carrier protein
MKELPTLSTVQPKLEPYGDSVVEAYERFYGAPTLETFRALTDSILLGLAEVDEVPEQLEPQWTLQGDLGLDSIGLAEAAFLVEDLFSHRLTNESLIKIHTVEDLHRCLETEVWNPRTAAIHG